MSDGDQPPFKPGDLVKFPFDIHWDYHDTVYTVAGIWPNTGWVQLREHANPVGSGLKLAEGATEPSKRFPPPLPDPGLNEKRIRLIEHTLDGGGYVQHWDDDDSRAFCPVCPGKAEQQVLF